MHETLPVTLWASSLDDPAFQKLVHAYRPMLYSIALSLWDQRLNSRFDPSDAIQETWATLASVKHSVAFANRQQLCVYLKYTVESNPRCKTQMDLGPKAFDRFGMATKGSFARPG